MSLTQNLKEYAHEIGFDLVGVTSAESLQEDETRLREWIAKGYAGKMNYLERHLPKKAHPKASLGTARSVVVLGMNYFSEDPPQNGDGVWGKIARYARGRDYHDFLVEKVRRLEEFIARETGRPLAARHYVDTGPLLEKALAQRAGFGFLGKNTLLLTKQLGSWLFLGELLLDVELDFDLPAAGSCGNCTRCVDACPTGALLGDYTMNASQCLTYFNIEFKEEIPEPIRPKMGNLLFGCDICQEVCPYTRRAQPSAFHTESRSPFKSGALDVVGLLQIRTDEEFRARFAGTPLLRPKRRGLLRNAAVVAANAAPDSAAAARALSTLRDAAAHDPDPLVRSHASWALSKLKMQN